MVPTTNTERLEEVRKEVALVRERGGGNPRVHPNGFLQLDLEPVEEDWNESKKKGHSGASRRLHIWNPPGFELPHQGTINEIHDHVFDMHSEIICGVLFQRLFEFMPGGIGQRRTRDLSPPTHERYEAVYDKKSSSRLKATGVQGWLEMVERFPVTEGNTYTQPAFTLHDTETPLGLVVTVMTKTEIHDGNPSVICPIDSPPDNDFDRATAADPDYLWEAIEASLA